MNAQKRRIALERQQRADLKKLVRSGIHSARMIRNARVLLLADETPTIRNEEMAKQCGCHTDTIRRIKKRFCDAGLWAALEDQPRPGGKRKLSGEAEALVIATACSPVPSGADHWTLDLLVQRLQEDQHIQVHRNTIQRVLLRNDRKPWKKRMWCIPTVDEEFTARMLDVLEVYERPYDPTKPQVCVDEKHHQLLDEKRAPVPIRPGKERREDAE